MFLLCFHQQWSRKCHEEIELASDNKIALRMLTYSFILLHSASVIQTMSHFNTKQCLSTSQRFSFANVKPSLNNKHNLFVDINYKPKWEAWNFAKKNVSNKQLLKDSFKYIFLQVFFMLSYERIQFPFLFFLLPRFKLVYREIYHLASKQKMRRDERKKNHFLWENFVLKAIEFWERFFLWKGNRKYDSSFVITVFQTLKMYSYVLLESVMKNFFLRQKLKGKSQREMWTSKKVSLL